MFEDMNEIEILTRMEKNYGPLKKRMNGPYSVDMVDKIEGELLSMLIKYRHSLGIHNPIPRIRMWIEENRINFLFFDRGTGRRILLGNWLSNQIGPYEH